MFPGINEAKQKDGNRAPMLLLPSQSAVIRMGLLPKLPGAGECVDIRKLSTRRFQRLLDARMSGKSEGKQRKQKDRLAAVSPKFKLVF